MKFRLLFLFCSIILTNVFGQKAIDPFSVKTINNDTIKIGGDDKLYVFYLWEIKVEEIINEISLLNKLAKEYQLEEVVFIAATNDKIEKVNGFLKENTFIYRQVAGKEGRKVNRIFGNNGFVRTYPQHIVIDGYGSVIELAKGSCSTIHEIIESKLKERK